MRTDTPATRTLAIETLAIDTHEQVIHVTDPATGLNAFIAIHDTSMGPALGGCRFWPFASEDEALADVLRLSRGMTFKNILAGLPHGGGKAVIIGDPRKIGTPALFRAFGEAMNTLEGRYTTGEDVGVSVADMQHVRETTPYVSGLDSGPAASGDPSPLTARGVVAGMRAALEHRYGLASFDRVKVGVQGLGHVGFTLCELLHRLGAQLTVADLNETQLRRAVTEFGATVAAPDDILAARVDILAPCALGGILNPHSLPRIAAPIIAGSANNQLSDDEVGDMLWRADILYAPDYVINAGGVINVAAESSGHYDKRQVMRQVCRIGGTLQGIFARAKCEDRSPHRIADEIALERLRAARALQTAA
ncbi:MAG TPA: amino acid dehydrogenase [Alphaproteobacteria bacterium]|nr:amino acid dehydrogenase [Alphaproteobacteria bacterium]